MARKTSFPMIDLEPPVGDSKEHVLWEATLHIPGADEQEFLFRSSEDFAEASKMAQSLVTESPGCKIADAQLLGVKRIARLWN